MRRIERPNPEWSVEKVFRLRYSAERDAKAIAKVAKVKELQAGYGEIFFESFEARGGRNLGDRLSRAAQDAGSFWYTAWTAAGRPALK